MLKVPECLLQPAEIIRMKPPQMADAMSNLP